MLLLQRVCLAFLSAVGFVSIAFAQSAPPVPPRTLTWQFPLPRPHTGVLLGNGTQGIMVWGGGRVLHLTISRTGFWDHRGGVEFNTNITYNDLKAKLLAKDEAGIKAAFAVPRSSQPSLGHPQQLSGGRLDVTMPTGWVILYGNMFTDRGLLQVIVRDPEQLSHVINIRQAASLEITDLEIPKGLRGKLQFKLMPHYTFVADQLRAASIEEPTWVVKENNGKGAFIQPLPDDDPLLVGYDRVNEAHVYIQTSNLYYNRKTRRFDYPAMQALLDRAPSAIATADTFWAGYYKVVPRIALPDPLLQEIIDYGLYKQAIATSPNGLACTLQGPFMEEQQLVPWSNDYHFNINIQQIYTPALATSRLANFRPLWRMINGWMPQLKKNGEAFFGRPGALMLPHAVDDRCHVVGTFWTGTIDHACTAWMAMMAWQNYRYGLDQYDAPKLLSETVWPLLNGTFEGYFAMLEEVADGKEVPKGGKRYSLPVSVSPEYRGAEMNAWGRDASFQLAALHRICRILPQAAAALGKPLDPRWADVQKRLPAYTTFTGKFMDEWSLSNERIALWEGMDLIESHRHHSHLGGVYPFATLDLNDPVQRKMVDNSLQAWRFKGAGGWSGWSIPWASILLSRTGQTDAAIKWLHYWKENYVNEGRGTLHNANTNGTSLLGAPDWEKEPKNREIMQLDAGFGALSAVLELLVQNRDEGIYVLPSRPRTWQNLAFDDIRTEGAFLIGATVKEGTVMEVRVKSLVGGKLTLIHPFGTKWKLNGQPQEGEKLIRDCKPGEVLTLTGV
jgi:alpha-L-fucosidase 2